tara:strand:+ start:6217 stop:7005 length:789 start_codon:yes stop_codon:yes gene_type:complete
MKIAFYGCGNMVQALFPLGLKKFDFKVFAFTPTGIRASEFVAPFNGSVILEDQINEGNFDVVVLGFKPQQLNEFKVSHFHKKTLIISLLAGTTIEKIQKRFNCLNVIRLMPNTPSKLGEGVTLIAQSESVNDEQSLFWKSFFSTVGTVFNCESEHQLDQLTPVTGSGPAYLFEWARIFFNYVKELGLNDKDAKDLVSKLFLGSSKMLSEDSDDFETLRNKVTSKKGVTYEALEEFKKSNLEQLTKNALDRAYERVLELGEES